MDIWAQCKDDVKPEYLSNELVRVVESQEQIATNNLVENLEEQDLLEQMLDETKPAIADAGKKLHYLLSTPFRYPPLKHGSRFGSKYEPSLFYGSHYLGTALAETSYYRFLFWLGMEVPPPSGKFVTQHTVFAVNYATDRGLKLHNQPFNEYHEFISSPNQYSASQQLGSAMRDFGIEAFEFISARDSENGVNAVLFFPAVLTSTKPLYQQQWLCETNAMEVSFYSSGDGSIHKFSKESFSVNGLFPEPAF